jgi:transcriptional regulator with XRE-family HTH domain
MKRKDLLKEIGYKLKKIREASRYSGANMASQVGVARSSYLRNENGDTCPDIISMRNLGNGFNVSLDWLICDKGPMNYREKEQIQTEKPGEIRETAPEDLRELLDLMKRIPLLRYKMLASFHEFKVQYKEMVLQPPDK